MVPMPLARSSAKSTALRSPTLSTGDRARNDPAPHPLAKAGDAQTQIRRRILSREHAGLQWQFILWRSALGSHYASRPAMRELALGYTQKRAEPLVCRGNV